MREIRKSGSMRGEGKRGDAHRAQATAPLLYSTEADVAVPLINVRCYLRSRHSSGGVRFRDD